MLTSLPTFLHLCCYIPHEYVLLVFTFEAVLSHLQLAYGTVKKLIHYKKVLLTYGIFVLLTTAFFPYDTFCKRYW